MYAYTGKSLMDAAMRLWDEDLCPRLRLYSVSPDGRQMWVLEEISPESIETGLQAYTLYKFGNGRYCARLFSTKYGTNILEGRFDFYIGRPEDLQDQGYYL